MREFFAGQLDYIFFFYGLSFMLVAAICFLLRNDRGQKVPWFWFGLFGVTHGMNEWLDLFAFSLGDSNYFLAVRLSVLALSYLFLFEFGRKAFTQLFIKKPYVWIYLPLIILAFSGSLCGPRGLNASIRYSIGLPGGLLSAYCLFIAARTGPVGGRVSLKYASIMLGLYSLATGAIVPAATFFPASWFNGEAFFKLFGFPVQLLRGILTLLLAVTLWRYSEFLRIPVPQGKSILSRIQLSGWTIVATLVSIIGVGWGFTTSLGYHSGADLAGTSRMAVTILANQLLNDLNKTDQVAKTISGSPWILPALLSKKPEAIEHVNSVLDRYNKAMDASACYLMDASGTTIASSNRNDTDSFVGSSFKSRTYFQDALSGRSGYFFGVGLVSNIRGYYASYPVTDSNNRVMGVVAVKHNLSDNSFTYSTYAFLTDPHGVIFLSSRPEFVLKSLWPIDEKSLQRLKASRQFGDAPLRALMAREPADGEMVEFSGEPFRVSRHSVDRDLWSVIQFTSARPINEYRLLGIAITLLFCVVLIVSFLALRQRGDLLEIVSSVAVHDPLTGLLNRRSLDEIISRSIARAKRGQMSALLFMDLDHFKAINDTLGHKAGDEGLIAFAKLLQGKLRTEDIIFRLGGDEFGVLLEDQKMTDALATAERLRLAVDSFPFVIGDRSFHLSLSIGLVQIDGETDIEHLIPKADAAMYRAKEGGRNRVVAEGM